MALCDWYVLIFPPTNYRDLVGVSIASTGTAVTYSPSDMSQGPDGAIILG